MLLKAAKVFILILFCNTSFSQQAYNKYSIDLNPVKNRRVSIGFFIQQSKQNFIETHELNKKRRTQKNISRKIQRHTYKIQTKEVKKRMKKTKKEAQMFNDGKLPLRAKLLTLLK